MGHFKNHDTYPYIHEILSSQEEEAGDFIQQKIFPLEIRYQEVSVFEA